MNGAVEQTLLRELTARVAVAPDLRSALVDGERVTASGPAVLTGKLAAALYDTLHLRRGARGPQAPARRDQGLEEELVRALPRARVRRTVAVLRREDDRVLVSRTGVRVWVPLDRLTQEHRETGEGPAEILVPAFDAAVSPGFFVVRGGEEATPAEHAFRLYANVAGPLNAPAVLRVVLGVLEAEGAAHRTKVCSVRGQYPRSDALVVYLARAGLHAVPALVSALAHHPGLAAETSHLALPLAPGVGLACEPGDRRPGTRGLSFGLHRCTVLAGALVRTAAEGSSTANALREGFLEAGVDPRKPWRNLDSAEPPFAALAG